MIEYVIASIAYIHLVYGGIRTHDLLDVERRWRSHSAEAPPQKAPRGPFHQGPFSPFKRTVGEADRPAPLFLTRKIT